MKKVLLFDYDGVIVDSLANSQTIYNQLCGKYGCAVIKDKGDFVHLFDRSATQIFRHLGISFWRIPFAFMDYRRALRRSEKKVSLFPGMKQILATLGKQHDIIIITSNLADVVIEVLHQHGVQGICSVIGSETSLSKVKKIRKVKKALGRQDYYYIGDTKHDIIEGRRAGVRTVAVTWGYHTHRHLYETHPDYLVDKPRGLLRIFG